MSLSATESVYSNLLNTIDINSEKPSVQECLSCIEHKWKSIEISKYNDFKTCYFLATDCIYNTPNNPTAFEVVLRRGVGFRVIRYGALLTTRIVEKCGIGVVQWISNVNKNIMHNYQYTDLDELRELGLNEVIVKGLETQYSPIKINGEVYWAINDSPGFNELKEIESLTLGLNNRLRRLNIVDKKR